MKDVIITDQPDGSAILSVDLTKEELYIFAKSGGADLSKTLSEEEMNHFVSIGVLKCLREYIENLELEIEDEIPREENIISPEES